MTPKLDLLLIHPPASLDVYGELINDDLVAIEPPLWCRLIAGYVRDLGYMVRIYDADALHAAPETVATLIAGIDCALVCIVATGHQPSASTQSMSAAGAIARAIKGAKPAQPIMMVGGHVSALPLGTMNEQHIDFACVGEGPVTIAALLALLRDGHATPSRLGDVPGLVWGKNYNSVRTNAPAALIEDMGLLHGDTWDLLPMSAYRAHNWQCFGSLGRRQPYASVYTSLGCPYKCSFCCINAPFGANRYRMRKPRDVVNEIVKLHEEYGVSTFKIVDEMFVLNEAHYTEIAEGLKFYQQSAILDVTYNDIPQPPPPSLSEREPFLNIWAYARVDTIRPHTLALLRAAGFRWLALGIESGSAHVRDGSHKTLDSADIIETVRAVQRAGINVIGNYIFGLPDDDFASMRKTLRLAQELNCEFANFYVAMAYPGSRLHAEAMRGGARLPATWAGYSQHGYDCQPLGTRHASAAEVLQFRDEAFGLYFTGRRYLGMLADKFGPETVAHVRQMTKRKLPRKLLEPAT